MSCYPPLNARTMLTVIGAAAALEESANESQQTLMVEMQGMCWPLYPRYSPSHWFRLSDSREEEVKTKQRNIPPKKRLPPPTKRRNIGRPPGGKGTQEGSPAGDPASQSAVLSPPHVITTADVRV